MLKSMFGLPFDVTDTMLWLPILVGGALLLLFQFSCQSSFYADDQKSIYTIESAPKADDFQR
jgi:hypothetical protein